MNRTTNFDECNAFEFLLQASLKNRFLTANN